MCSHRHEEAQAVLEVQWRPQTPLPEVLMCVGVRGGVTRCSRVWVSVNSCEISLPPRKRCVACLLGFSNLGTWCVSFF